MLLIYMNASIFTISPTKHCIKVWNQASTDVDTQYRIDTPLEQDPQKSNMIQLEN